MEENKKREKLDKDQAERNDAAVVTSAKNEVAQEASGAAENDDNIATPEEMEAFISDRRNKSKERRSGHSADGKHAVDKSDVEAYEQQDSAIDPYLEPDPAMPWVPYKESPFLSRGCNHCPTAYQPVAEQEVRSCSKVTACNWMRGIQSPNESPFDCVEVRFKNNRKDFYRLPDGITVSEGDIVAVEGVPGHDVGVVSLTGEVCRIQMMKKHVDPNSETVRKLFRRAKPTDIEKWAETIRDEDDAIVRTRRIVAQQGLVMKVNDVEFQGDRSKAIFYYTADDRVDFRNLIKVLADEFRCRVEMRQIGVRQEAGKVGGLGTCGRELCCATWLTNFQSVTTGVAKAQQILPNPQKLAGQCGKLKCCLNFEYEVYVDALKKFPPAHTPLRFKKGLALYKKTDVFRGIMWYSYEGENELYAITAESAKEIIEMNHNQKYPEKLEDYQVELMSNAALAQESSEAEFERELRMLADTGNEVVKEDKKEQREGRDRNGRRDGRDRKGGDRKDREGREHRSEGESNGNDRQRNSNRDRQGNRNPQGRKSEGPKEGGQPNQSNQGGNKNHRQGDRRRGHNRPNNRPESGSDSTPKA